MDDRHGMTVRRHVWASAAIVGALGLATGAAVVFGWMVDETHFDRPDAEFTRVAAHLDALPGADVTSSERWVEAPIFADPAARIEMTVDPSHVEGFLDAACAIEYTGPVAWSVRVPTSAGQVVSMHSGPMTPGTARGADCLGFGFDATALVAEVDRLELGIDLQPTTWDNGGFALVALGEDGADLRDALPLLAHAVRIHESAGVHPNDPVEIDSASLGVTFDPEHHSRYVRLLTELADQHAVTSFWGAGRTEAGDPVQIVAPEAQHTAIEAAIRASGLPVADAPVRFIRQNAD